MSRALSSPWFLVEIDAALGSGQYSFHEVWFDPSNTVVEKVGGRYGTVDNPGYSISYALTAGDLALCRSADGAGGLTWELIPLLDTAPSGGSGGIGGTGTDNHVVRWDGTSDVQDSTAILHDTGDLEVAGPIFCLDVLSVVDESDATRNVYLNPGTLQVGQTVSLHSGPGVRITHTTGTGTQGQMTLLKEVSTAYMVIGSQVGVANKLLVVGACYAIDTGSGATDGITGTRTVKDGSGNNKTVTITGGIITGWAT